MRSATPPSPVAPGASLSPELPDDWRERVVAMIRGAAPLDAALFRGGPALSPVEQIGVYRDQYRLRLGDAVREEIPGLLRLWGDRADERIAAYLLASPSHTFTLDRVAFALPGWLEQSGAPDVEVDMARLDVAVTQCFTASDPRRIQTVDLGSRLVVQPPVRRLRLGWTVHRVRAAVTAGEPVPAPERQDVPLVVFRPNLRVRHLALPLAGWRLLGAFDTPRTPAEAIEQIVEAGVDPNELAPHLTEWFRVFAEGAILGPPAG